MKVILISLSLVMLQKKIESEIIPTKAFLGVGGFGKGSISKKLLIMII
jgi:hypothetical protein